MPLCALTLPPASSPERELFLAESWAGGQPHLHSPFRRPLLVSGNHGRCSRSESEPQCGDPGEPSGDCTRM